MSVRVRKWPWFAILARTAWERHATLLLENAGYECYLPVTRFTQKLADRTKEIEVPLLPGYFFCRMNPHNRLLVLTTPGVLQIIGVGETPIPVEEDEIAAVQQAAKSGLPAMPWPYVETGHAAQIVEGPLAGLSGVVIKLKSRTKLVLSVSLLQSAIAIDIDRRWVNETATAQRALNVAQQGVATGTGN